MEGYQVGLRNDCQVWRVAPGHLHRQLLLEVVGAGVLDLDARALGELRPRTCSTSPTQGLRIEPYIVTVLPLRSPVRRSTPRSPSAPEERQPPADDAPPDADAAADVAPPLEDDAAAVDVARRPLPRRGCQHRRTACWTCWNRPRAARRRRGRTPCTSARRLKGVLRTCCLLAAEAVENGVADSCIVTIDGT